MGRRARGCKSCSSRKRAEVGYQWRRINVRISVACLSIHIYIYNSSAQRSSYDLCTLTSSGKFETLLAFCLDSECVNNEALIPGLPDDLSLICLAKISHGFLGVLECVCKRWRDVLRSEDYALYKSRIGRCGDWLFVLMKENCLGWCESRYWKAYDPEADRWHRIPPMPRVNELVEFSCVSICNRLLVIGGFFLGPRGQNTSSNQVFCFDPYRQEWSEVASLSTGRASFACSVICDKVYVGGRFGSSCNLNNLSYSGRNSLSSAEVYDPVKDRWDELPTMPNPRDRCFGVSFNSKFYILRKYDYNLMDIFSLHDRQWCSRPDVREKQKIRYPILAINDHLYTIVKDSVQTVNIETGDWHHVGPVPPLPEYPLLSKIARALVCSLRNKLYIIGGFTSNRRCGRDEYLNIVRFCDPSTTPILYSGEKQQYLPTIIRK